jgi:hypothetical protein
MGVDLCVLDFLLKLPDRRFGETLCLGRQGIHIGENMRMMARQLVAEWNSAVTLEQLIGKTGYAEVLFKHLGSTDVKSLDYSDYEGADFVFDLNYPAPDNLKERFDTVFDGGTLEHVYNFPVAIENAKAMARIGGRVMMISPANNFVGHGLYQFSPELLYRVFSTENGFQVEAMQLVEVGAFPRPQPMEDPRTAGRRIEFMTRLPAYLCVSARKVRSSQIAQVQQSDYERIWNHHSRHRTAKPKD